MKNDELAVHLLPPNAIARPQGPGVIVRSPHSTENIARVITDIGNERVRINPAFAVDPKMLAWVRNWSSVTELGEVINATSIYESLTENGQPIDMYDRTIVPPFDLFTIGYENGHGNDIVMTSIVKDREAGHDVGVWKGDVARMQNTVCQDWENVRWEIMTTVWVGGRGEDRHTILPTHGPTFMWATAVYADGRAADLRWIEISDTHADDWQMAHIVFLETLSFLSCTNIDIAEPQRSRPERRRMERESPGVRVKVLCIKPTGKRSAKSTNAFTSVGSVPLHTVRGHFAHYGACCATHEPRGLLFGKYEGKVFVPGHARGNEADGKIDKTYLPTPETT